MNKKIFFFLFIFVTIIISIIYFSTYKPANKSQSNSDNSKITTKTQDSEIESFVLSGYPIDEVPLESATKISSMKYFVNDDTSSKYLYGGPVNYYNVVFLIDDLTTDIFNKYKTLMSSVNTQETTDSNLIGYIGKYKVSVTQYNEDDTTVYLEVILPPNEFNKENPYYLDAPSIVKIDDSWIEKESSFGKLNQKGGEIEYSQYFNINSEELEKTGENPFSYFAKQYVELYKDKTNFEVDQSGMKLKWQDEEYEVNLIFSDEHSRVYLMIRKPL